MTPFQAAMQTMDHPWRWGTHDCCSAACGAFALLRGIDPMQPLRGRYDDAAGALAVIEAMGGWEQMAEDLAKQAGLTCVSGGPGALGLHMGARAPSLVLGIVPGLWAGKTVRGLGLVKSVVRAWA